MRRAFLAALVALGAILGPPMVIASPAAACPAQEGVWSEDYITGAKWVQCNYCGQVMEGDEQYGHYESCTGR